jgi:hypothetical protein
VCACSQSRDASGARGAVDADADAAAGGGAALLTAAQFYKWHAELASAVRRASGCQQERGRGAHPDAHRAARALLLPLLPPLLPACSAERAEKYQHYATLLLDRVEACGRVLTEVRLDATRKAAFARAAQSPGLAPKAHSRARARLMQPAFRSRLAARQVDDTLSRFDELRSQHQAVGASPRNRLSHASPKPVVTRTRSRHAGSQARSLAAACERLLEDKARLGEFAAALRAKLAVFEQLDSLAAALHSLSAGGPAAAVERLPPLLRAVDGCLDFCAAHPQYADAAAYALKFRQLQARALSALRAAVGVVLRRAVAAASAAAAEATAAAGGGSLPEGAATGVLYVRFRAAAPEVRPLLAYAEARAAAGAREYAALLGDVRALYAEARLALLQGWAGERVAAAADGGDACALARSGAAFLLSLTAEEHALFEHFFPGAAAAGGAAPGAASPLAPLVEPLAVPLYDALRPALLALRELEPLAELVDVLRREVLGDAAARHGDAVAAALPTLRRVLADAQERLAFRAHTFLRQEVAGYTPAQADIDMVRAITAGGSDVAAAGDADAQLVSSPPARSGVPLYRPVSAALGALARLYGAVEPPTFGALAQEAVAAATYAVASSAHALASAAAPPGTAAHLLALDAHLLVASQLLALREQTASFDGEFVVTERALEFSSMRGTLRRILSGESPLFSLTADNGLFALAARGAPRTVEARHDGRKDLEAALKASCEAFILCVTKTAVEPLLGFLAKATAARGAAPAPGALRSAAFAGAARVTELVAATNAAMASALAAAAARARAYLPAASTRTVLFRPIKANIAEAHAQMAALLEAEYTPEEVASIGLTGPEALRQLLDAHDDE